MGAEFTVSADIAAWTDIPYINPKIMGGIDFVNLMSYFFDASGSLVQYQSALSKLHSWGFNNSQINLGIPFYDSEQSEWEFPCVHRTCYENIICPLLY